MSEQQLKHETVVFLVEVPNGEEFNPMPSEHNVI